MEFVLVVKRYDLFDLSFPHGFRSLREHPEEVARYVRRIREKCFFMERRYAELDSSFKQVIPYCIVSTPGQKFMQVERLKAQGESRLHGKLSVGIGGHINPVDHDGDALTEGCRRELQEELSFSGPYDAEAVGIINDESQDVGSVHFGVVFHARFEDEKVSIGETDHARGALLTRDELLARFDKEPERYESWSSLILEGFDQAIPTPASAS